MDHSLEHHQDYIGLHESQLPTPSLVLSLSTIERNIRALHDAVSKLGIDFRPHVKTLKALEVTRLMLDNGKYRKAVASTLSEIRGLLPLVQENILDECLYGLPVYPGILPQLYEISQRLRILLMIDNEGHVGLIEGFNSVTPNARPWGVFIKVNVGSNRAGAPAASDRLRALTQRAEASSAVSVLGYYCHAGHSYASRTDDQAEAVLHDELNATLEAAKTLPSDREVIISIGATPTAHVVDKLKVTLPANVKLELHAGNFCVNDLQQLSTGLIDESQQALRICAEVCSVYPERNEALVNAGVIALSRETSAFPGFGKVAGKPNWSVVRLSQEHGILGLSNASHTASNEEAESATETFEIGQKVFIYCQHACITAAAFHVYYVVDQKGVVTNTWIPWKGW